MGSSGLADAGDGYAGVLQGLGSQLGGGIDRPGAGGGLVLGCLPDCQETFPLAACRSLPGFCGLGALSFGVLYLPAVLALIITAIGGTFHPPTRRRPGPATL